MILIDTSAWIEFLRDTGSTTATRVRDCLIREEVATCGAVYMEVLAGARSERHLMELRRLLARAATIAIEATDYDQAASLYRHCRRGGETIRSLVDCLIAAAAIRAGVPVLHHDADFDALARHSPLLIDRS
ncbi:MAG: PIN domain nuclease [Acidobacteria bacterium]|nr:PIN domain nuclease [Acidobacteriota bacterium]